MNLKKSVSTILGALLLVTGTPALSQEKDKEPSGTSSTSLQLTQCALKVSGMSCGGCAGMVERGLLKLRGVREAKVDWKSGGVKVEYDKRITTPEELVSLFNKNNPGFRAQLPKPKNK